VLIFFLGSKHGRKKESNLHKITTLKANAAAARYSAVQPRWKFPELPTHAPHPIPAVKYVSLALLTPLPPWSQPSPSPLHASPLLQSAPPPRRPRSQAPPQQARAEPGSGSVSCGQRAARILISSSFDGDRRKVTGWELTSPPTSFPS
jgi:hypothetical protein